MRHYDELTLTGQSRRLRRLAADALRAYGLRDPRFTLIQNWENATFRVDVPSELKNLTQSAPYVPGRYLLRLHRPDRRKVSQVASELAWLTSLSEYTDVIAPVPVRTRDGHAAFEANNADYPELGLADGTRVCSLLRWVPGRMVKKPQRRLEHIHRVGVTLGRMHNHAQQYQPDQAIDRPPWDVPTLMGRNSTVGIEPDVWDELPEDERELHSRCEQRVTTAAKELGTGQDVFGLIHSDLHFKNVLFVGDQARPIDFDDVGQSHYVLDLATTAFGFDPVAGPRPWQDALVAGYRTVRPISDDLLSYFDIFCAARQTTLLLWCRTCARDRPDFREALPQWRESMLPTLRERLG